MRAALVQATAVGVEVDLPHLVLSLLHSPALRHPGRESWQSYHFCFSHQGKNGSPGSPGDPGPPGNPVSTVPQLRDGVRAGLERGTWLISHVWSPSLEASVRKYGVQMVKQAAGKRMQEGPLSKFKMCALGSLLSTTRRPKGQNC